MLQGPVIIYISADMIFIWYKILTKLCYFTAGGRLEEELAYTKATVGVGSGTTSELVIQTPKEGSNILTQKSLLLHLETLLRVTEIEVDLFETYVP